MKQEDYCVFCFNGFHGNEEKDIVFQIDVMLNAELSQYESLYDTEVSGIITNRNTTLLGDDTDLDNGNILILKKRYSKGHARYIHGVHFTKEFISCPTKA